MGTKQEDISIMVKTYIILHEYKTETGNAYLIEGNTWGDIYWGMSNNFGENKLGIILMKIRTYFQRNNIL